MVGQHRAGFKQVRLSSLKADVGLGGAGAACNSKTANEGKA
jgi:hypothetical protein